MNAQFQSSSIHPHFSLHFFFHLSSEIYLITAFLAASLDRQVIGTTMCSPSMSTQCPLTVSRLRHRRRNFLLSRAGLAMGGWRCCWYGVLIKRTIVSFFIYWWPLGIGNYCQPADVHCGMKTSFKILLYCVIRIHPVRSNPLIWSLHQAFCLPLGSHYVICLLFVRLLSVIITNKMLQS